MLPVALENPPRDRNGFRVYRPAMGGRSCERLGGYKTINRIPLPIIKRSCIQVSITLRYYSFFHTYLRIHPFTSLNILSDITTNIVCPVVCFSYVHHSARQILLTFVNLVYSTRSTCIVSIVRFYIGIGLINFL